MGTKNYANAADLVDFARASTGTALRKISYGSELVTNGTFDTDTDWTKQTGWTISGGVASCDGTQSTTSYFFQPCLTVGELVKVTVNVTDITSGTPRIQLGNTSPSTNLVLGENEIVGVVSGNTNVIFSALVGAQYSIDNISVKEVLFDQPDGTLTLFNHPVDVPRIEYNADGTVKGLLVEEQRTNLYIPSEDTLVNYASEISKTSGASVWLTGEQTADLITPSTVNSTHYFGNALPYSSGTSDETYSFFAKASGYYKFRVYLANQTGGYQADFDLSAETATNTGALGQSIVNMGSGWYRCSMTFTSTKINPYPSVKIFDNSGNETFAGDGTSGIYFVGHQLEAGSFPTSYIPTEGSQVIRAADICNIDTDQFGYNPKEGTLVVEADLFGTTGSTTTFDLNDDTTNNRILVNSRRQGTSGSSGAVITSGTNVVTSFTNLAGANPSKVALAYAENDFASSANGSAATTDTSGAVPQGITVADIGYNPSNQAVSGHIKSIDYIPRRLTNEQLQELTS